MSCGIDTGFDYPSDPNNDSTLNAIAVNGGIRIYWSYPTVNPQSVTHTKIFKGTSSAFGSSTQLANTAGDDYFDSAVAGGTTYYYWIQIVSINGTTAATIGPASATAISWGTQIMSEISGQILSSDLAAALQSSISQIETNRSSILSEGVIYSGLFDGVDLDLAALGLDMTSTNALIVAESSTRTAGFNAQATLITGVIAQNVSNAAAVVSETNARVTADTALATSITAVVAITNSNLAAVVAETLARTTADTALAGSITTIEASVVAAESDIDDLETFEAGQPAVIEAAIQSYNVAQVGYCQLSSGDISTNSSHQTKNACEGAGHTWLPLNALATAIKTVQINDGVGGTSTIEVFTQAVDTRQTSIESDVTAAEGNITTAQGDITTAEGNISTAQGDINTAEGNITAAQNDIGGLEAQYTVKLQTTSGGANPTSIVGGFGLASTTSGAAATISAGFNVSEFWVADLSDDVASAPGVIRPAFVPFAISGGVVYIKTAFIEDLTVGTIKFAQNAISQVNVSEATTRHKFTPNSGWDTAPATVSITTTAGNVDGPYGYDYSAVTLDVTLNWQVKRKEGVGSVYGYPTYADNLHPIIVQSRSRAIGGTWSAWGVQKEIGKIFLLNQHLICGACTQLRERMTLRENWDWEFRLDSNTFAALSSSSTNGYFDWAEIDDLQMVLTEMKK
jgi:peptidoglycan hydrolase CwlO-like protein